MKYDITTQKELRAAFWEAHPDTSRKKIKDYDGKGTIYTTDTRSAFGVFVDTLERNGTISEDLAFRATL